MRLEWSVPPKTPASVLRLMQPKEMRSSFASNSVHTIEDQVLTPEDMFWRIFESTEFSTDVLPMGNHPPESGDYGTKKHVGGMQWHFHHYLKPQHPDQIRPQPEGVGAPVGEVLRRAGPAADARRRSDRCARR